MTFIDFSKDYQRLFRFDHIGHGFLDSWMDSYKHRDAMVLTLGDNTTYMMPRAAMEATLAEGVRFFRNDEGFQKWAQEYQTFIPRIGAQYQAHIAARESVSRQDVAHFCELASAIFDYFYKTEFFFLDEAYQFFDVEPVLRRNMEALYRLKERARVENLNATFFGEHCYQFELFNILSRQFDVDRDDLRNYGVKELDALFDGQKVSKEALAERRIARIIATKDGEKVYCFGEEAKKDILELREKTGDVIPYGTDMLKGTPANKGVARGRVKIITSTPETIDRIQGEFDKMQKGDILMAETTSPEFMPACAKAGAIVADQGGLLSHAAVVSREFGIPCVVAIKYATKVFKDGDVVEVDGAAGTVKLIERA